MNTIISTMSCLHYTLYQLRHQLMFKQRYLAKVQESSDSSDRFQYRRVIKSFILTETIIRYKFLLIHSQLCKPVSKWCMMWSGERIRICLTDCSICGLEKSLHIHSLSSSNKNNYTKYQSKEGHQVNVPFFANQPLNIQAVPKVVVLQNSETVNNIILSKTRNTVTISSNVILFFSLFT